MPVTEANIGQIVKFTSRHPNDGVTYQGTVRSITDYAIAKRFSGDTDLTAYRGAVAQVVPDINPLEELSYFIIELNTDSDTPVTRVFANEFIDGAVSVIDDSVTIDIRIWGVPSTAGPTILTILQNAGYGRAKVLATTE